MAHVLDDFIFLNLSKKVCKADLEKFKMLCDDIGIPLAIDKTFDPEQIMEFLGILLNTLLMEASLPIDKIKKCRNEIMKLLAKNIRKVRVKQLQSIIGLLNFACRVVSPGRAFLRRLIDITCGVRSNFHRVRITNGVREDLKMWLTFLTSFNGTCMFVQPKWLTGENVEMFSDSCRTGFGAICGSEWFSGRFPPEIRLNITILELFPILLAVMIFKQKFAGRRVIVNTDNMDLLSVISKKTSREPNMMPLVRELVLQTMSHNCVLKPVHIKGKDNGICDALSRSQFQRFRVLAPHMDVEPVRIPKHLLPSQLLARLMKK